MTRLIGVKKVIISIFIIIILINFNYTHGDNPVNQCVNRLATRFVGFLSAQFSTSSVKLDLLSFWYPCNSFRKNCSVCKQQKCTIKEIFTWNKHFFSDFGKSCSVRLFFSRSEFFQRFMILIFESINSNVQFIPRCIKIDFWLKKRKVFMLRRSVFLVSLKIFR